MDATGPDLPGTSKPCVGSPSERRFALCIGAVAALLTLLPYLAGWARHGAGSTGLLYDGAQDGCVYLSWMRQAAEGRFFLENRFVTDPQQPRFTHLLYWAMGGTAGLLGGSAGAHLLVYHGARVLLILALFLALARLLGRLLPDERERRLALLLAAFSGGIGWLTALLGAPLPWRGLDFGGWAAGPSGLMRAPTMPEAITFLCLLHYPHFVAALALMVVCVERAVAAAGVGEGMGRHAGPAALPRGVGALAGRGRSSSRPAATQERAGRESGPYPKRAAPDLVLALAALALAHVHSYDVPPLILALLLWGALRGAFRVVIAPAATLALGAAPALAYQAWVVRTDPLWAAKAAVPVVMPPALQWLPTYGLLLPAAAVGVLVAWRRHGRAVLLPAWAAASFLLACAPVAFQRKMLEGFHLPLAMLAALGVCALARRRGAWVAPAFALAAGLSTFATLADACRPYDAGDPWRMYPPLAIPTEERAALDWLAENARPGDGVLSWRGFALYLPVRTPCAVYAGHWGETPHYFDRRLPKVAAYYAPNTSPQQRERILVEARARFVWFGRAERGHGGAYWRPDADPRLRRVFSAGESALYEVAP